jgi:hypothetical protein
MTGHLIPLGRIDPAFANHSYNTPMPHTRTLLMTVEQVFELGGQGLVLVPGVSASMANGLSGATIELRRPDGTSTKTTIASVNRPTPNTKNVYPIGLAPGLAREEAPIGTEVWLLKKV